MRSLLFIFQKPKQVWAFLFLFSTSVASANEVQEVSFFDRHVKPVQERAFDSTSRSLFFVGAASTLFALHEDDRFREQWRDHQTISHDTSKVGDNIGEYAIGPLISVGQLFLDPENGQSHVRALVYTGLVTHGLKLGVGRKRPNHSNDLSFPSGHSSSAFATATSLTYAYGPQLGLVAYPIATFVAFSRLADDMHWFSDAVAGAFIGIWMGRASFYSRVDTREMSSWYWTPILNSRQTGVLFRNEF